jgi:hypothetical protein
MGKRSAAVKILDIELGDFLDCSQTVVYGHQMFQRRSVMEHARLEGSLGVFIPFAERSANPVIKS